MGKVFGVFFASLALALVGFLITTGLMSYTMHGLHEYVFPSVPALGFLQTGWVVLFLVIAGGAWNSSVVTRLARLSVKR